MSNHCGQSSVHLLDNLVVLVSVPTGGGNVLMTLVQIIGFCFDLDPDCYFL